MSKLDLYEKVEGFEVRLEAVISRVDKMEIREIHSIVIFTNEFVYKEVKKIPNW